jgi:1-acyl-sn-glycerol-3-phosphate acyltransferase
MPARWIRRPLTVTAWIAVALIFVALSPVLLAAAWIADRLSSSRQPLIWARLVLTYFSRELVALGACGLLWLFSGGGRLIGTARFQRAHWRLLRWFAAAIAAAVLSRLDIEEAPEPSPDAERALHGQQPVLVFSRHAGPADTFLMIDRLASGFGRHPSVILKHTWALEPFVDLLGRRLPHAMIDTADGEAAVAQIESVASQLGPHGALLLFPEGGNFTPQRRRSILHKLRRKGRRRAAARAQQLSNVLPPRPSGALAAIRGNPRADVVFAAHTGLGLAAYPRDLWRDTPIGRTLRTRMWLVPAAEIPGDSDEQVEWLNRWWRRIDAWIEEQR